MITIAIRLRYDYAPTIRSDYDVSRTPASIRREQKMNMSVFRRSRVVVVSQSNRTQTVISMTSIVVQCVVVSSYRSRIVVESQLWYRLKAITKDSNATQMRCHTTLWNINVIKVACRVHALRTVLLKDKDADAESNDFIKNLTEKLQLAASAHAQ